jgi:hypothetical protein
MTNFPSSLDTFNNPSAGTSQDAPGFEHDIQHSNLNDAVAALQAKVGINSSTDQTSMDYKLMALVQMFLGTNQQFKFAAGQFCIWDSGAQAYRPLVCVNGQLGVGSPVS